MPRSAVTRVLLQQQLLPQVLCSFPQQLQLSAMVELVTAEILKGAMTRASNLAVINISAQHLLQACEADPELAALTAFLAV